MKKIIIVLMVCVTIGLIVGCADNMLGIKLYEKSVIAGITHTVIYLLCGALLGKTVMTNH